MRSRKCSVPTALAAVMWAFVGVAAFLPGPRPASAQEPVLPATDAPAPPAATAPATGATTPSAAPAKSESLLVWLVKTSGWIGAIILALSFYFVAVVCQSFFELRMSEAMPVEVVAECENLAKAKNFNGLYKLVKEDTSFFSQVVRAGLTELQQGWSEAREAMEDVGDALVVEMERRISMLAVLGTLGPMIGLLGTLKGMIGSFSVIAMNDTQIKAGEVAGHISEALVLTFEGVALSVPAIYFFAYFRNRIASISTETMVAATQFMRQLNVLLRPAKGAATGPVAKVE